MAMGKDTAGLWGGRKGARDPDQGRVLRGLSVHLLSFSRFPNGRYTMVGAKTKSHLGERESPGPPAQVC